MSNAPCVYVFVLRLAGNHVLANIVMLIHCTIELTFYKVYAFISLNSERSW